jgi:hypothetical protein
MPRGIHTETCAGIDEWRINVVTYQSFIFVASTRHMPPEAPYEPSTALLSLVEDVGNVIKIARCLIEDGRSVDLTGLDHYVGLLCAKTLDLPPEQGRTFRPALLRLRADVAAILDTLAPT